MLRSERLPPIRPLRSALALAALLGARALGAQAEVTTQTPARAAPGGSVVATLAAGARLTRVGTQGAAVRVRLEGWVVSARLGARRDSFPASVNGSIELRLRTAPSAQSTMIAEFLPGAGLTVIERQGPWSRVRREVWVNANALRSRATESTGARSGDPRPATATGAAAEMP